MFACSHFSVSGMDSSPLRFSGHLISSPTIHLRCRRFPLASSYLPVFTPQWDRAFFSGKLVRFLLCSRNNVSEVQSVHIRDVHEFSEETSGLDKENGKQSTNKFSSTELLQKLKRYGIAGVLSYGLLNTVYYLTTFLFVWFYFAPAPGRMGYAAAVKRFLKVMAMPQWCGLVAKLRRSFEQGGHLRCVLLLIEDYNGSLSSSALSLKGRHLQQLQGYVLV